MLNAILDPFYGLTGRGKLFARFLNRILIVAELAAVGYGAWYHATIIFMHSAWVIAFLLVSFPFLNIINGIIRSLWNLLVTLRFGTTNPDDLADIIASKEAKIDARKASRAQKRASRKANTLAISKPALEDKPVKRLKDSHFNNIEDEFQFNN